MDIVHLEEFVWINAVVDEFLYFSNDSRTVGRVCHTEPFACGVKHFACGCSVIDEFVHNPRNEIFSLWICLCFRRIEDVLEKLVENDLSIGGEQSGHIIFKDVHTTGDGILSAIEAAIVAVKENKKFSDLFNVKIYPQTNVDVVVDDKLRVINSEELDEAIADFNEKFKNSGRIMIRASGTEPKIRIMVESENESANKKIAADFINLIKRIK